MLFFMLYGRETYQPVSTHKCIDNIRGSGHSYWLMKQYVRTLRSGRPILEDTQDSCKYQVSRYITVHQVPSWRSNLNEFNVTIWKLFTMHGGSTFSTPRATERGGGLMRVKCRRKHKHPWIHQKESKNPFGRIILLYMQLFSLIDYNCRNSCIIRSYCSSNTKTVYA